MLRDIGEPHMKNTFLISSVCLMTLISCAGTESYQAKMMRYKPHTVGNNTVPEILTSGFQLSTVAPTGRMPASAASKTTEENQTSDEINLSNKKLYFLSLYGQYETLNKYTETYKGPKVNICPSFHTSLLEHNDKKGTIVEVNESKKRSRSYTYDMNKLDDPHYVASNPELLLPVVKDEVNPKVIDKFRSEGKSLSPFKMNEIVQSALDIHLAKTYSEIRQLCEFGVSDNYYIYENLITHIKSNSFLPAEKNLNTLLKTTLFSNLAIVTSIQKNQKEISRSIASVESNNSKKKSPYSSEVMTRLNVEWAQEYYEYLGKTR